MSTLPPTNSPSSTQNGFLPARLMWGLVILALVSVLIGIMMYVVAGLFPCLSSFPGSELVKGLANAFFQLAVIGVAGALVKYVIDRRQEELKQEREERAKEQQKRGANNELRKELIGRVISANRAVRLSRILLKAAGGPTQTSFFRRRSRSNVQIYDEQMVILVDSGLDYSEIAHELKTVDQLFTGTPEIRCELDKIANYLINLADHARLKKDFVDLTDEKYNQMYLQRYYSVLDKMRDEIMK